MKRIKTHTFNGANYDMHFGACYGGCDPPNKQRPNWVNSVGDTKSRKFLEISIHESLHACNWKASEELVTQTAYDIARLIWKMGYRLNTTK